MTLSSAFYLLAVLATANAVTIAGWTNSQCSAIMVSMCSGIPQQTCCNFPSGGYQAQSLSIAPLYSGCIGVFYQSSATSACGGTARDSTSGYSPNVCLSGGLLSTYFGGGGAWFDCCTTSAEDSLQSRTEGSHPSLSGEALQAAVGNFDCTSRVIPTIFGWEGEGVWVLKLQEGPDWDQYNQLPVTTNIDVHIENLKAFGAAWYPNARDSPDAAVALDY